MNKNKFFYSIFYCCFSFLFAEEDFFLNGLVSVPTHNGYEVRDLNNVGKKPILSTVVEESDEHLIRGPY